MELKQCKGPQRRNATGQAIPHRLRFHEPIMPATKRPVDQQDAGNVESPAVEQLQRLSLSYDIFNTELFGSELPPVMLRLGHKPGSYGYFQPNKWMNAEGQHLDVINLDSQTAADRPLLELLSTLVHEMAHAWVFHCHNARRSTGGHGRAWRERMTELGLPPVQIGRTWGKSTHRIDPDGRYACTFFEHQQQLQALPWRECIARAGERGAGGRGRSVDRVRFQCPRCNGNAWARPAARLLCGSCSSTGHLVEMVPEFRPAGGAGAPGAGVKRENYPEPKGVPGLPVWTDELSRELRLHTGLEQPPTTDDEAWAVLKFGLQARNPELLTALLEVLQASDADAAAQAMRAVYVHRCKELHPDAGGSEVAFKSLQTAWCMVRPPRAGEAA